MIFFSLPSLKGRDLLGQNASQAFLDHAGGMIHPANGWVASLAPEAKATAEASSPDRR